MAGSGFGTIFHISTWGESHGKALGVVIDGCPAGLELSEEDIQPYLDRRKPGSTPAGTTRKEDDAVEILSGVFEGKTTGTPISMIIRNTSQRSGDYGNLASVYRPGHADYGFDAKYGIRDYRGGGRASGRETAARVAAGAVACKILERLGIRVEAYTLAIGSVQADLSKYKRETVLTSATAMPDADADAKAMEAIEAARRGQNSLGGILECRIGGVPAGIGDPVFEKLDANLAKAVMGIGAVKAVEIGDGCKVSTATGQENNDPFAPAENAAGGIATKKTNHAGGILGGISDGSEILVRAYVKPTPSVSAKQETVDKDGNPVELEIAGRHDPVIAPRAAVVMEAMCALTVLDAMLLNMSARMDRLEEFYRA